MGKATQRKADDLVKRPEETHLQWRHRIATQEANARDKTVELVSSFASAHGDYRQVTTETEEGERAVTRRNVGGTPLARWRVAGMLSPSQDAAIMHCLRLWRLTGQEARVTASYGERMSGGESVNELRAVTEIEARDDLKRITGYIPRGYWSTFENCVRFDEPAGVVGSRLGYGDRSAKARAHQVVCFVADIISMRERLSY